MPDAMLPDCSQIQTRLTNAISARDRLINGEAVVIVVDAFRSRIEYRPADLQKLTVEVARLQVEYAQCINPELDQFGRRRHVHLTRPVQFLF